MKRPWIVKAGGELLTEPATRKRIFRDLIRLARRRPVVFVHGGGPQIEAELKRQRVPARFVKGRRATSSQAMIIVERILSGEINKGIAAELKQGGAAALGLSGRDAGFVVGKPIAGLGRAATPKRVNAAALERLLGAGFLPVLSPVASDARGNAVNINADDAASAIAVSLGAAHLVFLTNIAGVLNQARRRIPVLRIKDMDRLIDGGVITGGMIPKVQGARAAIRNGVGEIDIADGREGIRVAGGTRIRR